MKNKSLSFVAAIAALFLVTSSWNHFETISLATEPASLADQKAGVTVTTRVYTEAESATFLHQNLYKAGYVPVEVSIHNHTAQAYTLSAASVSLPLARGKDVAWSVTKKSIPRGIGLKVASLFFWPFMVPSTIDSIVTAKAHRKISNELTAKTLKETDEIIPPYASVTRVLYVKKEGFQKEFSVALQEVDSKDLLVVQTH